MKIDIEKYRELADRIGGDDGRRIHALIDSYISANNLKLLGNQEAAKMLNIDPKNMHHKRKTKFFPDPVVHVGKFPLWLESDIREYIENIEQWRKEQNE